MDLVTYGLSLSWSILERYQDATTVRGRCKAMVDHVERLAIMLKRLKPLLPNPLTPDAEECFKGLADSLVKAYRLMDKAANTSTIRYLFTGKQIAENMSEVTCEIEHWLRSLPLIQLGQAVTMSNQVEELQASFTSLGEQLKKQSTEEQTALAAEVLQLLQSRNSVEGQEKILDKFLSWIAERFDSDMQTLKNEWQEMKCNPVPLSEQGETSTSFEQETLSKSTIEEELLQQIILCIDELEAHRLEIVDTAGTPGELICSICLDIMHNPVIISSGHSYCGVCIKKHFEKGQTLCPKSRVPAAKDVFIENIALRAAIYRWKQHIIAATTEEVDNQADRVFELDFVRSTVSELQSENDLKRLRALNQMLEICTSANGAVTVYTSGGIKSLSNLLSSTNKTVVEQTLKILVLLTSRRISSEEDAENVLNEIFESSFERLITLLNDGTTLNRLRAAEILSNLLSVSEVTECLRSQQGVVSSFATLAMESQDGREICLKGLQKLAKNIDGEYAGPQLIIACLVDLLKAEVEEAVVALRPYIVSGGSQACNVVKSKNSVNHIVSYVDSRSSPVQEAALVILEHFMKYEEGASEMVAAGFMRYIPNLILNLENDLLQAVLHLSRSCLESYEDWSFEITERLRKLVPRLIQVLDMKECTVEALMLLKTLSTKDIALKELILDNGGLKAVQSLAVSPMSSCRKGAFAVIRILIESPSCHQELSSSGGIELLINAVHTEESVECRAEAIVALDVLAANVKLRSSVLEALELDRILSFLDSKFPDSCRQSAVCIALLLIAEAREVVLSKPSVKQLTDLVLNCENSVSMRRKAGGMLLLHSKTKALDNIDSISLQALIGIAEDGDEVYKDLLLSFISHFNPVRTVWEAGGTPLLLEAFSKEYARSAAASIQMLAGSTVSSHSVLLEGGFGRMALEFLTNINNRDESHISDIASALVSIYSTCDAGVTKANVIRLFLKFLKEPPGTINLVPIAARSLASFLPLDDECASLLRKPDAVKPLLLELQSERKREALELLNAIVEDSRVREQVYKENAIPALIACLSLPNQRVQELATSILIAMGKQNVAIPENQLQEIRRNMVSNGIILKLLPLLQNRTESSHLTQINSACLMRNLGFPCENLKVLLELVQFYTNNSSNGEYVERLHYILLAVQSPCGDRQKKVLLQNNIGIFLQCLQTEYGDRDDAIKNTTLAILRSIDQAPLSAEMVNTLRCMLEKCNNDRFRRQYLLLFKHLIETAASKKDICKLLREQRYIQLLVPLKETTILSDTVNEVLHLMRKHDKESKRLISQVDNNYRLFGTASFNEHR